MEVQILRKVETKFVELKIRGDIIYKTTPSELIKNSAPPEEGDPWAMLLRALPGESTVLFDQLDFIEGELEGESSTGEIVIVLRWEDLREKK